MEDLSIKDKDLILKEIKNLVNTKGYIYALCMILYEDFHYNLDEIHLVNPMAKMSVKECSLLIGFLVQSDINFEFPNSPEELFALKEKTYDLMQQLHYSLNEPVFSKLKKMAETSLKNDLSIDDLHNKLDFFAKDGGMVEPMFYAGDGVYDFQYLEYLGLKYRYDQDWLLSNYNFNIEEIKSIVNKIKNLLLKKSKDVNPIDIKDPIQKTIKKEIKKLKKSFNEEDIKTMEKKMLMSASFFRYKNLFPPIVPKQQASQTDWHIFYKNLINLFVIEESDLQDFSNIKSFLNNFSFAPGCNAHYAGPGYYNILNSKPLIKLDNNRYFVPLNYLVAEAVYESPFYWMFDDIKYRDTLSKHRGDVGEEIAYEFLSKVFGIENTFKSVLISTKKGQPDTDIDVLCVLGNKALCVQVKSKKLTLQAKRGDFDQLSKDFKGAVQDAYNQGLVSKSGILNSSGIRNKNGEQLILKEEINEVYIMGLTTENYPSLAHQVHTMLLKDEKDPFPLFLSVFDLELLGHYLPDPYDFLYYVRQRVNLMEYFKADEEIVYLGYHLDRKLCKLDNCDYVGLESDFGGLIDRNYYPYKMGLDSLLSSENDPLQHRWKDAKFDYFTKLIKSTKHPNTTDIIFNLLDWSGDTRKGVVEEMILMKNIARKTFEEKSIATGIANGFGLSFIIDNPMDRSELKVKAAGYAEIKKYQLRCSTWLGIGSFANSPNLIDYMVYLDEPWIFNAELEAILPTLRKNPNSTMKPLGPKESKLGRNDPCPCKSGLKYKKCCGAGR